MTATIAPIGNAIQRAAHGAMRLRYAASRAANGFRLRPAERLLIAPQELESGDPSVAMLFYSGQIMLAGKTIQTQGRSPFLASGTNAAWRRELHGFAWLRHFRDADSHVIRHHARALLSEWLNTREFRADPLVQLPGVTARRTLSWLTNAPLLLANADHSTYQRFMRALARDAQWLEFSSGLNGIGIDRLFAAIALAAYSLCALTPENDWKRSSQKLAQALRDTVMEDGTPASRSPADALRIAIDLLQLRTAYGARGRAAPPELQLTLDRLLSFLRMLRHPDGTLALFNGVSGTTITLLGTVLAFGDALIDTASEAKYGGYHRLSSGNLVMIVDTGAAPERAMSTRAHAGPLSFELSDGQERIIVNCGAGPDSMEDLREALRETAAHSTLVIDAASSLTFRPCRTADGSIRRQLTEPGLGPTVQFSQDQQASILDMSHDGYARSHGVRHRRVLRLTGEGLSGEDSLVAAGRRSSTSFQPLLRFHLHPRVTGHSSAQNSVQLTLGDGSLWQFEAENATVTLEESIFLGGLSSQRRAQQIVVRFNQPGGEGVRWSLSRSG